MLGSGLTVRREHSSLGSVVLGLLLGACGPAAHKEVPADTPPTPSGASETGDSGQVEESGSGAEQGEAPPVREDGTIYAEAVLMGTRWSMNVWLPPGKTAREAGDAIEAAFTEVARIESIASEWRPDSDVTRFNLAAGGEPMKVPPELLELLTRSREVSEATDGLFDASFHGVGSLWRFDPGAKPPTDEAIAERLPLVDYRSIEVDAEAGTARLAKKGMKVGFGAIAKGYAVDRASAILTEAGFEKHVVEGGGDTYVSGRKDTRPWTVGVQDPGGKGAVGALRVENLAVVTSGNYQRFFEHEGVKYAHILDPRTGKPIPYDASPRSVTLVARNATDADAYCTAVTIMGADKGLEFVDGRDDLQAVIIDSSGTVRLSQGLEGIYFSAEALGSQDDPRPPAREQPTP